jgi:hypothetical protein
MMRTHLAVALACLLVACAKPLPANRVAYTGEWRGGPISLEITADGGLRYLRKEGNRRTWIRAPIKEFNGDNFLVGVGFMSTEFVVSAPPHGDGDDLKMTVDGVELTRVPQGTLQLDQEENKS